MLPSDRSRAFRSLLMLFGLVLALGGAPLPAPAYQPGPPPPMGQCKFPPNTLPEGSTFPIPIEVDSGPAGAAVTAGTLHFVGVVNNGKGAPPPAPPLGSVVREGTVLNIWDETDGTTLVTNSWIPAQVDESNPFADGCYAFRVTATVIRTYPFQSGHTYIINVQAHYRVTRYVRDANGQIKEGPKSMLAWGTGTVVYYQP